MARLTWHNSGTRKYEVGVKNGVLYPIGDDGQYLVHRSFKIVIDDHVVEQMLMLHFFLRDSETLGDDFFRLRPSALQS